MPTKAKPQPTPKASKPKGKGTAAHKKRAASQGDATAKVRAKVKAAASKGEKAPAPKPPELPPANLQSSAPKPPELPATGEEGTAFKKVGPGRPTILTPELTERVRLAVQSGAYLETAAAYVGISKDSLHAWLKQGRHDRMMGSGETLHALFSDAVEKAMATAEMSDMATLKAASKRNWQAAAWRLERRFPDRWGRRRLELSGPDGRPIQTEAVDAPTDLSNLTDEELEQYEALMGKLAGGAPQS